MSERPLDKFEQKLVDSYKNYELPYSQSLWNGVSRRLLRKRLLTSLTFWSFTSIALLGVSFGAYTFLTKKSERNGTLSSNNVVTSSSLSVASTTNGASGAQAQQSSASIGSTSSTNRTANTGSSTESNATESGVQRSINVFLNSAPSSVNSDATSADANTENAESPANGTNKTTSNSKELTIQPSIRTGCAGTEIEFSTLNSPKDGSYLWNFGDGSFSNEQSPKHVYKKSGTFDVSLSITNPTTGQISTKALEDLIQINPAPAAEFDWVFTNTAVGEPCAKFVNLSTDANGYTWQLGSETVSEVSPQMIYSNKGRHHVKLSVTNEFGCYDETVKYVQINNDFNLGADEKASVKGFKFMPDALKKGNNKFKLTIYNGQNIVFETTNKAKSWSGELPNNKRVAAGETYPWIVLIYGEDGSNARYYSGTLTIVP